MLVAPERQNLDFKEQSRARDFPRWEYSTSDCYALHCTTLYLRKIDVVAQWPYIADMSKTAPFSMRLEPKLKDDLQKLADADHRSLTNYLEVKLREIADAAKPNRRIGRGETAGASSTACPE